MPDPVTGAVTGEANSNVVAVVLAAGGGSRFDGPTHKLDAVAGADGRTVVRRAVDAAVDAAIGPVVVVAADHVRTSHPVGVAVVGNPGWTSGQMSSLRLGIDAARAAGATRIVVGLGDQPGVEPSAWRAVAAAGAGSPIAIATYEGVRGHPVSLDSSIWDQLPTDGDEGARTLMRLRPDLVREVPCQGSPRDIDTLEDLHRWQNSSSTSSP